MAPKKTVVAERLEKLREHRHAFRHQPQMARVALSRGSIQTGQILRPAYIAPILAIRSAVRQLYPHSLSYQLITLTIVSLMTAV